MRKHPFDATLSDGKTKIQAQFNKDSTKKIMSRKGSSFTSMGGGVIIITDYFVVSRLLCLLSRLS
jgi:hypothetical protein